MIKSIDKKELEKIINEKFEGYFWLSNEDEPANLDGHLKEFKDSLQQEIPFVIEANFYNKTDNISISLRHVEGRYLITQIDLNKKGEGIKASDGLHFKAIKGFEEVKIINLWQAEPDDMLEGMEVMQPILSIFAGFKN